MRIRYDNALGALGASLASGESTSTITFQSAPAFRTLVAPDYIALVLEPPTSAAPGSKFEVVYLTAYTSGQTTGTIKRGRGGTSSVSHAPAVSWMCGPVSSDFGFVAATVLDGGASAVSNPTFLVVDSPDAVGGLVLLSILDGGDSAGSKSIGQLDGGTSA